MSATADTSDTPTSTSTSTLPRVSEIVRYVEANPDATAPVVLGRFVLDPREHRERIEALITAVGVGDTHDDPGTADAEAKGAIA